MALEKEDDVGLLTVPPADPSLDGLSDERVVALIAGGDVGALGVLYDRYAGRVFGLARRVLGDAMTAEEVTQDAFLTVWRLASVYRPEDGAFSSWFLTIARNLAIDALRRGGARQRLLDRLISRRAGGTSSPEDVTVDRLTLSGLLGVLPPEQRACLELAFYRGLTHRQIAETTGTPLGTVKTRIRLGLQKLREALLAQSVEGQRYV